MAARQGLTAPLEGNLKRPPLTGAPPLRNIYTRYSETPWTQTDLPDSISETDLPDTDLTWGFTFPSTRRTTMSERTERLKAHLSLNRQVYITGATCLAVGIFVGVVCKNRPAQIVNTVAPVFNNNVSATSFGGYAHKIIRCNETGQLWESLKSAAESAGVSPSLMSKHVNGHHDHISGLTYSIIGLGTNAR